MKKKVIIFEELFPRHHLIIWWHLLMRHEVYFLRVNRRCARRYFWETGYIAKKCLKKLDIKLNGFDGFYYDAAFNNINKFYEDCENNKILQGIIKLYGNSQIGLAYKKAVSARLSRCYYLNHIFNAIGNLFPGRAVIFIPSNGIEGYRTDSCEVYDYRKFYGQAQRIKAGCYGTDFVKFPFWVRLKCYCNLVKRRCDIIGKVIFFSLWLFARCIKRDRKNKHAGKRYKYAFAIISPARQFANNIQKVDFLVDGIAIKREEAIFLAAKELGGKGRQYLDHNSLNYLDKLDIFVSLREAKKVLLLYVSILSSCLWEDSVILETGLKGIYFFAIWESLLRNVEIEKLVTFCDYEIKGIFRNIILERHGCVTIRYLDAANFGCFFTKDNSSDKYGFLLGFLYGDYFISWNDKVSEFFKYVHCSFKSYINLGCFWSEHVKLIQEGKIHSSIRERLFLKGYQSGMKIISIFDSSFNDDSFANYGYAIEFLKGIYSLVEDMPGVFFILKEKNKRTYHRTITASYLEINALYKKFDEHSRCYLPGNKENSSEVIALSDLTVSFPFSSTSLEALASRRKGIWYDPTNKFSNTFYDAAPNLVCHSYAELLKTAKELLYGVSEVEYGKYLDRYVLGRMESYLDGKAISRFREFLAGNAL